MNPQELHDSVHKAAGLLRHAHHAVALTGAGISTPSGIPDFRSAGTGLWTQNDPMRVASLTAFRRRPADFFNWLRPLAQKSYQARPNPAHFGLAELEKRGILTTLITQNIDGLHQQAGSRNVLEVHGSLRTWSCERCRKSFQLDQLRQEFFAGAIPRCPECSIILKPDVVLYEEALPEQVWSESHQACRKADVFLVVGSALEVIPAADLPLTAVQHGAALIINTLSPTYLDDRAVTLIPHDVAEAIPQIVAAL